MHETFEYEDNNKELEINNNVETKAFSVSESESNNSEEDSEEVVKSIYLSEAQQTESVVKVAAGFGKENATNDSNSILTKMENSHLILDQTKEAQRSINGAELRDRFQQSSSVTTSSVSSSTSISSSNPDELPVATEAAVEAKEPTVDVAQSDDDDKLHEIIEPVLDTVSAVECSIEDDNNMLKNEAATNTTTDVSGGIDRLAVCLREAFACENIVSSCMV